jgi:hypothetical protein
LCDIFGEERSDGRYSRLAHNADPSAELPVLMTGTGMYLHVTPDNGVVAKNIGYAC